MEIRPNIEQKSGRGEKRNMDYINGFKIYSNSKEKVLMNVKLRKD